MRCRAFFGAAVLSLAPMAAAQPSSGPGARADRPTAINASLPGGAQWAAEVPPNWNGTLLLWGRGYSPKLGSPEVAPNGWREALLARGYALAASNYGAAGWALAEAVPAQRATIAAFAETYGKPQRTIAWGQSMGGLVSTALAEQRRPAVQGAIVFCPSIGGAIGMMNMGLDGAFAFRTLLAHDAGLELVGIRDDMANGQRAQAALTVALKTPQGRARVALAGVLGGIPGWTVRGSARPAQDDYERQVDEIGANFVMGTFLPRQDQERRAGWPFSWNTGIDYVQQLERSGRRGMVAALYQKAGLDLAADLARLNSTPRIAAKPAAVRYMLLNYTPTARPRVPLLSVQAIGDGLTSPSLQRAYVDAADPRMVQGLWLDTAGHCGEPVETALTALGQLEERLARGHWPAAPPETVRHVPAPMLRPCLRGRQCR